MKKFLKRLFGECTIGWVEYFLKPDIRLTFCGPFNGQSFRQRIFFDLLHEFPMKAIIETGTFRGTTTSLFIATGIPVYSCEMNPRNYGFSKARFMFLKESLLLSLQDSREFLRKLSCHETLPRDSAFFYLDAHWGDDLPLCEELEIIFESWVYPIVMIDDFCVPASGYGFDHYGPGKALTLDYIAGVVQKFNLAVFFPAIDASKEKGRKRGCVVLCDKVMGTRIIEGIPTLLEYRG